MKKNHDAEKIKAKLTDFILENSHVSFIRPELSFCDGARKADLAYLDSDGLHAFEIKSSLDDMRKLSLQVKDYEKLFNAVSVVFCIEHMQEVKSILRKEKSIGLIIYNEDGFEILRKPRIKKRIQPGEALKALTVKEIKESFGGALQRKKIISPKGKMELINAITENVSGAYIQASFHDVLRGRYAGCFRSFMQHRGSLTLTEDLVFLRLRPEFLAFDV